MSHLKIIRQYDHEFLTAYINHFQEAINKISNLDEREDLSMYRGNVDSEHNEKYVVELIKNEPWSLETTYAIAIRFIKETNVLHD